MRNLALWKTSAISLTEAEFSSSTGDVGDDAGSEGQTITALALDLDQDALLLNTERKTSPGGGEAAVSIWRLAPNDDEVRTISLDP